MKDDHEVMKEYYELRKKNCVSVLPPPYFIEQVENYLFFRVPPGSFLRAVLENKLVESFMYANETNRRSMFLIAHYIHNVVPRAAWGSSEAVQNWLYPPEEEEEDA